MPLENVYGSISDAQPDMRIEDRMHPERDETVHFPDSMQHTQRSELGDHGRPEHSKKDSFFQSRVVCSNQSQTGFNKTTNFATLTPAMGTKYNEREMLKLNTLYNSRNTKSMSGGLGEMTSDSLSKVKLPPLNNQKLNFDPVQSSEFNGFALPYIESNNGVFLNSKFCQHMADKSEFIQGRISQYKDRM